MKCIDSEWKRGKEKEKQFKIKIKEKNNDNDNDDKNDDDYIKSTAKHKRVKMDFDWIIKGLLNSISIAIVSNSIIKTVAKHVEPR